MQIRHFTRRHLVAIGMSLASATAVASGTHAGGNGHDEEAVGKPGIVTATSRVVTVSMSDNMRFSPARVNAKQGETIRFIIKNDGNTKHEFVLGSEKDLKEHYEVMKKNPEMEHSDPNMITLAAGESGEVVWQFTKAGKIDFACLQPGHYDAGMKGAVMVAKASSASKTQPSAQTGTQSDKQLDTQLDTQAHKH
jgi:uncharacterized cupredoxin-like copper-binding protein